MCLGKMEVSRVEGTGREGRELGAGVHGVGRGVLEVCVSDEMSRGADSVVAGHNGIYAKHFHGVGA